MLKIGGRYINKNHIVSMGFVLNSSGNRIFQVHTSTQNGEDGCFAFRPTEDFDEAELEKQLLYLFGLSEIKGLELNL